MAIFTGSRWFLPIFHISGHITGGSKWAGNEIGLLLEYIIPIYTHLSAKNPTQKIFLRAATCLKGNVEKLNIDFELREGN